MSRRTATPATASAAAPRARRRATATELNALTALVANVAVEIEAGVVPPRTPDSPGASDELAALQRRLVDAPPRSQLVRVWWAGLAPQAREQLSALAALAVGNLDGVPWPARVEANRRTLAAFIASLPAPEQGRRPSRRARRAAAHSLLLTERLHALYEGPGLVAREEHRPRFLIACDPERNAIVEYVGHAIAATDDPFASPFAASVRNVALFVPGNESDIEQFEGKAHTMSELVHDGAPGTTGLIVWQGGRFPHGPFGLSSAFAVRLGARFGAFVNAIPRDPTVRLVAFGFSFGGAVVGTAVRLGMRVDAVAHLSSAGLGPGVRSLADYPASGRVPHVAMLAPGDVQVAPYLGVDLPRGARGIGHGANPAHATGVTRLETGFLRAVPEGADPQIGRTAGILRGHAAILERWGTTAKHGMRAALAGGRAELAAPRSRLERLSERLGLPWSPLQRSSYAPEFTSLPGEH